MHRERQLDDRRRLVQLLPLTVTPHYCFAASWVVGSEDTALNIGSYIGVPVTKPDGATFGMLCCMSHEPNFTSPPAT